MLLSKARRGESLTANQKLRQGVQAVRWNHAEADALTVGIHMGFSGRGDTGALALSNSALHPTTPTKMFPKLLVGRLILGDLGTGLDVKLEGKPRPLGAAPGARQAPQPMFNVVAQ